MSTSTSTNGHASPILAASASASPTTPLVTPYLRVENAHYRIVKGPLGRRRLHWLTPGMTVPEKLLANLAHPQRVQGYVLDRLQDLRQELATRCQALADAKRGRLRPQIAALEARIAILEGEIAANDGFDALAEEGSAGVLLLRSGGDPQALVGSDEALAGKLELVPPRRPSWLRQLGGFLLNLLAVLGVGPYLGVSLLLVAGFLVPAELSVSENEIRALILTAAGIGSCIVAIALFPASAAGRALGHLVVEKPQTDKSREGIYVGAHLALIAAVLAIAISEMALGYAGMMMVAEVHVQEQRMMGVEDAGIPFFKQVAFAFFSALGLLPAVVYKFLAGLEDAREARRRASFAYHRQQGVKEALAGEVGKVAFRLARRQHVTKELERERCRLQGLFRDHDRADLDLPEPLRARAKALEAIAAAEFADLRAEMTRSETGSAVQSLMPPEQSRLITQSGIMPT